MKAAETVALGFSFILSTSEIHSEPSIQFYSHFIQLYISSEFSRLLLAYLGRIFRNTTQNSRSVLKPFCFLNWFGKLYKQSVPFRSLSWGFKFKFFLYTLCILTILNTFQKTLKFCYGLKHFCKAERKYHLWFIDGKQLQILSYLKNKRDEIYGLVLCSLSSPISKNLWKSTSI